MNTIYNEKSYYLAVFESRNHALQIYQYLKNCKLSQYQLISTPCKIKSGCSYSIKFLKEEDMDKLIIESKNSNKNISAIYLADRINGKRQYKKIKSI